ncbi:MAG: aldo/keto reductase, partial [Lachnospiraceae bacterium]|nr:aldo/keto reductase [Lachnospiraceae bacterium]
IFYHHRMDPDTPLEETMGALEHIVRSGKALYVGLSNYDGPTMERAAQILSDRRVPFIINQNKYSIFVRLPEENGLLDSAVKNKKGVITFSPLAQGLLSDRYLNGIPEDSRIKTDGRFLKAEAIDIDSLNALNEIAQSRGQSLAQMALAWLMNKDAVTSVLIGASKKHQILDNIKAMENISFTEEELANIDAIAARYQEFMAKNK